MPIYECHCIRCDLTFEVLAGVAAANQRHACPDCGKLSPRIASTFAIVSGGTGVCSANGQNDSKNAAARKSRQAPLCLQNPHIPLLCHMDEPSARRWVAHFNGGGAEYDDKRAARDELRKKRGLPPPPAAEPSGHLYGHENNPRRHSPGLDAAVSTEHGGHRHGDNGGGHRDRGNGGAANGDAAHEHAHGGAPHHSHAGPDAQHSDQGSSNRSAPE